jgi:hypothetical protein
MSAYPAKKTGDEGPASGVHRIRITLTTSKSVANLEKVRIPSPPRIERDL